MRVLGDWLLSPARLAVHEPTATAVVADLHLGYGEARRRAGDAVPLPSLDATLEPTRRAARETPFRRLVVAGDLFERRFDAALYEPFVAFLASLGVEWLGLVPGNHDRGLTGQSGVPLWPDGLQLGAWTVAHGDQSPAASRMVIGHWHPCVRYEGRKHPCFLVGPDTLVLPAYSRDAAGADWRREPRWRGFEAVMIAGDTLVGLK